jgi:hypothetical protein
METKDILVEQLNRIADLLQPLTAEVSPGSLIWNGSEYRAASELQEADPDARQWYGMLTIAAGLLKHQSGSLSKSQIAYLKKTFIGGMGSLHDLSFDESRLDRDVGT